MNFTYLSQRATETNCENSAQKDEQIQSLLGSKSDRYLTLSNQITLEEMFTGHGGPVTMNVYWSVAIFTSDRTSGPVGSCLPAYNIKDRKIFYLTTGSLCRLMRH